MEGVLEGAFLQGDPGTHPVGCAGGIQVDHGLSVTYSDYVEADPIWLCR